MKPADALQAVLVTALWGFNFVAAKLGLTEFPPIFLIAVRFTLVALLLVWFVRPPLERIGRVAAVSVTLGGLHFSLMFTGLQNVDAGTAALTIQLQVPFAALLAALFFNDPFGWRSLLGMLLSFAGMVLIAGAPSVSGNLPSLALVLGAALVWAIANLQIKALGQMSGLVLNAWISLLAAPQLFLASWLLEDGQWRALTHAGPVGWGAIAYMALLVTIVGYGTWYRLLGRYPVSQTMPFMLLVPVFGVLSGVAFLGEALTWEILAGGALTITGVGIIVLRRRPEAGGLRARAARD